MIHDQCPLPSAGQGGDLPRRGPAKTVTCVYQGGDQRVVKAGTCVYQDGDLGCRPGLCLYQAILLPITETSIKKKDGLIETQTGSTWGGDFSLWDQAIITPVRRNDLELYIKLRLPHNISPKIHRIFMGIIIIYIIK